MTMALPRMLEGKKPEVRLNKCNNMNKAVDLKCMVKCRFKKQVK
jgi:DNA-binding protein